MVISAGRISPGRLEVRALYSLQNAIRLMPKPARAGPMGGAGLALPASICNLVTALTFFMRYLLVVLAGSALPRTRIRGRSVTGWGPAGLGLKPSRPAGNPVPPAFRGR